MHFGCGVRSNRVAVTVYDENRKFLGYNTEVAESTGAMDFEVSYQGTGDHLKVFFLDTAWGPNRPSSKDVSITEE